MVESQDEQSEKESSDEIVLPSPQIHEGVAPFPQRLEPKMEKGESSKPKEQEDTSFDLWQALKDCKISIDLPTLAAISLVCRKELYNKLVCKRTSHPWKKKKETQEKETKV